MDENARKHLSCAWNKIVGKEADGQISLEKCVVQREGDIAAEGAVAASHRSVSQATGQSASDNIL